MICLATAFTYLKPGGFYFIEDLQTKLLLKYQSNRFAFDNTQITDALISFISTSFLPRLYITRDEREYLVSNIDSVNITYHNGLALACIKKNR